MDDENLKIPSESGIAYRLIFHLEFSERVPLPNNNTFENAIWFILSADYSAAKAETGTLPKVRKNIMTLLCTKTGVKGCFEHGI